MFLVEAVTSHGPARPKRVEELGVAPQSCGATRQYLNALPDFRQLKRHVDKTFTETKVWVVEIPDHLIRFNKDKSLGPRENPR